MSGNLDFVSFYLTEEQRIGMDLTWNHFYVYVYYNKQHNLMISTERVPLNLKYKKIKAQTYTVSAKIVLKKADFNLDTPYMRYTLKKISPKTYQVIPIHSRVFFKEKTHVRIIPLSKSGRAKAQKMEQRCLAQRTQNGENPNLFDSNA